MLILRTTQSDGTSTNGFLWPHTGKVEATDWMPTHECGHGLHGLAHGVGDGSLLDWSPDAAWYVVEAEDASVIDLVGTVKFPSCEIRYRGDRKGATDYIIANDPLSVGVVGASSTAGYWGTATAGDWGTATAGDWGTATAGYRGTATAGDWGTATAGDWGTATAGYRGTATAGYSGTATAGDWGILNIRWWDGHRYRIATFYVGENGIEPNVRYQVDQTGQARVANTANV